ncbi:MAG: CDP-alcohol phosphatidyltransferase family protein [Nitrospinales bacterium]
MNAKENLSSDRRPLKLRGIEWIRSLAQKLAKANVSPNMISVIGLMLSAFAGLCFLLTNYLQGIANILWLMGVILIILKILCNTLDGMVAIEGGLSSSVGVIYNEAPDRLSDCLLLIGAGYGAGGSIEMGYAAALTALFTAYVRTLNQSAGAPSNFCGPMAKGQRFIILMIAALYSSLAPSSWQLHWGPEDHWGVIALALAVIILGGIYTSAKRLLIGGKYLRSLK